VAYVLHEDLCFCADLECNSLDKYSEKKRTLWSQMKHALCPIHFSHKSWGSGDNEKIMLYLITRDTLD
jgi:hypothetical protein